MNYRSVSDLNDAIARNIGRLPDDIDLVVGVPRSGLLAANLYALITNVSMTDLAGFTAGRLLSVGRTRAVRGDGARPRRVLVIDDSINGGASLRAARAEVAEAGLTEACVFCAVFGADRTHPEADIVLERVPRPRLFQWNAFHHKHLEHACVSMDGVLHRDLEPDDEEGYARFLADAAPLQRPSVPVGHVVSGFSERLRPQAEAWLQRQGIRYGALHMLGSAGEGRRAPVDAKAALYRATPTALFVEGEPDRAERIARDAGKPVLCTQTQFLYSSTAYSPAAIAQRVRNTPLRLRMANSPLVSASSAKAVVRGLIGERRVRALKRLVHRPARALELSEGNER